MDVFSLGETGVRSHRSSARIARVWRLISGHGRYLGRGWCVVRARGSIQSPVLVGRDSFLALIEDRLAAAAAGEGRLLFVAGEAGIGKTRLLSGVARRADADGFAVASAAAFPDDVQSLAGLLLDLAGNLLPAREPALSELGRSLTSRVRAISDAAGDAHHQRRVLVQDLADLLVTADPGTPVLIILEDLHWADELSLDVLGHLASRLATRPLLITGAYRSDELYPRLPMRDLRARLLGQRLTEEIRLPRLGLAQTAAMTSALLGRPAPAQMVQAIHERSDGIPLPIQEFPAAVDAATGARSSRRTSSRHSATDSRTSTRSPPPARPRRFRPTARLSSCTGGRCATCPPSFPRSTGPGCSPRSATRPRPPTTTRPPPR